MTQEQLEQEIGGYWSEDGTWVSTRQPSNVVNLFDPSRDTLDEDLPEDLPFLPF